MKCNEFKERVKKLPVKKIVFSIAAIAGVGIGYYAYKKYFGKTAKVVGEVSEVVVNAASDM